MLIIVQRFHVNESCAAMNGIRHRILFWINTGAQFVQTMRGRNINWNTIETRKRTNNLRKRSNMWSKAKDGLVPLKAGTNKPVYISPNHYPPQCFQLHLAFRPILWYSKRRYIHFDFSENTSHAANCANYKNFQVRY